ncbi:hypothetical protein PINS_up014117 [Pythium insidiosum]|nr:hypothetical protein PINS_up014117 [Pythium insidiosum]
MSTLQRSHTDAKPTKAPFMPRDVFRLLVRLEEQKTHDVDTEALERRFRVPEGYSKEETIEQRELLVARNSTPGPGTYEVPSSWRLPENQLRPSAVFASQVPRSGDTDSSLPHHPLGSAELSVLEPPPPLGSFTRADRGLLSESRHTRSEPTLPGASTRLSVLPRSRKVTSFSRAPRLQEPSSGGGTDLGPAAYEVARLWDPSPHSGRHVMTAPSPAVFSADRETRDVVWWSPVRGLPSCARPTAWDSSPHYAKQKKRVLDLQSRRDKREEALSPAPEHETQRLAQQQHEQQRHRGNALIPSSDASDRTDLDPFEWLRRLPEGDKRVQLLLSKLRVHNSRDSKRRQPEAEAPSHPNDKIIEMTTASQ